MKKLLLLFIPLMFFFGCDTDEAEDDESTICGNVSIVINGESRDYNPIEGLCRSWSSVTNSPSGGVGVSVVLSSSCENNYNDFMVGIGLGDISGNNSWSFNSGTAGLGNCVSYGNLDFFYYDGSGSINNINYDTRTVDGSFYLPGNNERPEIECSFSNVPFQ